MYVQSSLGIETKTTKVTITIDFF